MVVNNLKVHSTQILEEAALLGTEIPVGAKIAIIPMGLEHPEGYQVLEIMNGKVNIDQFSDNECTEINASTALDFVSYPELNGFILSVVSKLRKGGTLSIGGIDAYMFARLAVDDSISIEEINSHIYSRKALTDASTTRDFLISLGLEILSVHFAGINYEIKARRS